MGYDRGDSFPFEKENSKGKLSPRSYPIQYGRTWKYSFLSVSLFAVGTIYFVDDIKFIVSLPFEFK